MFAKWECGYCTSLWGIKNDLGRLRAQSFFRTPIIEGKLSQSFRCWRPLIYSSLSDIDRVGEGTYNSDLGPGW